MHACMHVCLSVCLSVVCLKHTAEGKQTSELCSVRITVLCWISYAATYEPATYEAAATYEPRASSTSTTRLLARCLGGR